MRSLKQSELSEEKLELTSIAELTPKSRRVNIAFTVLGLKEERHVRVRSSGLLHRVTEACVADTSASINLTLWDDDIDEVKVGKSFLLKNAHVGVYNESMRLNVGRSGELHLLTSILDTQINQDLDMSKPFAWMKRKRRKRTRRGMSFRGVPGNELKGYCPRKDF
jgi:ssDNA-binding replication factor A large subunit